FLGSVMIFVFLVGLIWGHLKFKKPPLIVPLFFLMQVISALFSQFPHTAFWGYYPRLNGGLVSSLIWFGLFVVAYSTFDFKQVLKLIFISLVLTAIPVSVLGILQSLGWAGLGSADLVARVSSTIGQPNWLAIYLVWAILLVLHRFLRDAFDRLSLIWLGLFCLFTVCFWLTYSLSGLLSLSFGIVFLLILNRKSYSFLKLIPVVLVFLTLATLFPGMLFLRIQDGFTDFIKLFSSHFFVYAQSQIYNVSDPGFIRLGLWEGTLSISFSSMRNFIFGTGPETFSYIFPFFRPSSLNFSSEWDFILNKPHNYYLELLPETGIFSLISYLAILFLSFVKKHPWGTGLLVAFVVSNFFGWPSVVMSLYFWVFLAGVLQYEK
ncbi:MAG TPA: hypothetical protein ENN92_00340, partial [candidate division WWE3 bacterium]|nr:hypothetical protein [candidate division WWE3 bacterium]